MTEEIIELFKSVVETAWKEEKAFGNAIFGTYPKRNANLCQGISRNIYHKIFGTFPNTFMAKFEVNKQSHIVVHVSYGLQSYVIDGTIKQFLPQEERTVFPRKEYPFKKEFQTCERWLC